MVSKTARDQGIRSLIPARIDRLPWSRFHTRLVVALGVAWVLYGLEITIVSNVGPLLTQSPRRTCQRALWRTSPPGA